MNRALPLALSHLLLMGVMQWENAFFTPHSNPLWLHPFLLLEPLGVSALLLVLTMGLSRRGWYPLAWSVVTLLNLLGVVDQAVYAALLDHLHPDLWQSGMDPALLMDSLKAEIPPTLMGNLLLWGGLTLVTRRPWPLFPTPLPHRRGIFFGGALYLALSLLAWWQAPHPLERHFLTATLHDLLPAPEFDTEAYDHQRDGRSTEPWEESTQESQQLLQAWQTLTSDDERPNIILVILESGGAVQVLTHEGGPDPRITPTLHRLAQSGILFPNIYPSQLASVGSIVELHSGGFLPTWKEIPPLLERPYTGITLPRALKGLGYQTALMGAPDLSISNVRAFTKQAGYDLHEDFGNPGPLLKDVPRLNSWGGEDGPVMARAAQWVEREARRPFLLTLLTNAPHHPYTVAKDAPVPFPGSRIFSQRYYNALHTADAALGRLLDQLEKSGQLHQTLWIITGDHGESLGERHPNIRIHINHLYEESGRTFLLVSAPGRIQSPLRSRRMGSLGDIFPTLLGIVGASIPATLPGQDLFSMEYHLPMIHFFMGRQPTFLGTRDGRWKFILKRGRDSELYDLEQDPTEQHDLAPLETARTTRYATLARGWFMATNQAFLEKLQGWSPTGETAYDPFSHPGPKVMTMGVLGPELMEDRLLFHPQDRLHPHENGGILVRWVNDNSGRRFTFRWTSQHGDQHDDEFTLPGNMSKTQIPIPHAPPLPTGRWRVELLEEGHKLIETTFTVDEQAPLHVNNPPSEILEFALGVHDPQHPNGKKIDPARPIRPGSPLMLYSRWLIRSVPRAITTLLISPEQVGYKFPFQVEPRWNRHFQQLNPPAKDLVPGRWQVLLLHGEGDQAQILLETYFMVTAEGSPSPPADPPNEIGR